MSEQEHLDKSALCDLLMKEGIDGWQDDLAVARVGLLTDLAVELGREDGVARALAWYEVLEQKDLGGQLAMILDYGKAIAIAGQRYGTKWQWEQPTLAREIFHIRRAVSRQEFAQAPDQTRSACLNNLGNRLAVSGRVIEALDYWRRALDVQANFGMALCNRARFFVGYADALEDTGQKTLLFWMAHKEASRAVAATAIYTDVHDKATVDKTRKLKERIESVIDVEGMTKLDPLTLPGTSATEEEREYRRWCLDNCLYLNPLNDLGPYTVANYDSMTLGTHVVPVDAPHIFASFFDQMKQEYVSARWLLYEGSTEKLPHFSDGEVLLGATEPRPSLSLAIEKVKAAYRISYSLFDKVGFFVNSYMGLGIPEKQVSFRTLWRTGEKKPIRGQFDNTDNWGFCALYWLAKDFFEKENDEVAEPQARGLSEIRNHIEHKYLRVTETDSPTAPHDDLAFMVSRAQFESKAIHLLKLARSALIYLAIGVAFEERRREPARAALPLEEIPATPHLTDAEKV